MILIYVFLDFSYCRKGINNITSLSSWDPNVEPQDAAIFEDMLEAQVDDTNSGIALRNQLKGDRQYYDEVKLSMKNALAAYEHSLVDPNASVEQVEQASKAYNSYSNASKNLELSMKAHKKAEEQKQEADISIARMLKGV